ncbi:hypothetical protein FRC08_013463 [Ceratobasidium sp. 394]|nr:hypothetical protein FRC08_013463 [Ceratobasidium sp. 394]KAG9095591.1 hypothetical protein FS749_010174 [Ceratobasidium sp. UAMH 11750]
MSNPVPTYVIVDPAALVVPADQTGLGAFLESVKDTLVAITHNLTVLMQQTSADLATANQTLTNHDTSVTKLETLMINAMAAIPGAQQLDRNKAVSFRVAVTHYLRVSYPRSTVDEQIVCIMSCLDGRAHEWAEPYLEQDVVLGTQVSWLHDLAEFWVQFNVHWNVSNKTEYFRTKFKTLEQAKSVQEYFEDFQTYSQTLGYNNISLRDFFCDGLLVKIKEMLMAQDFDHSAALVMLQVLAKKALKIDQCLEAFNTQNKHTSSSSTTHASSSGSKNVSLPLAASPTTVRDKMSVGENVYSIGPGGKVCKGTIQAIGKGTNGKVAPTVKWNDGSASEATFKQLKKDTHPVTATSVVVIPVPSGPVPWILM